MVRRTTAGVEVVDLAWHVDTLAEKYQTSSSIILHAIALRVDTLEELRRLSYSDLDAIVQEGLAEIGRPAPRQAEEDEERLLASPLGG